MQFRLSTLLLAVTIVPPLVGLIVLSNSRIQGTPKRDAARMCLELLADAVLLYRQDQGEYPSNLRSLHSEVGHDGEPILTKRPPLDPWGREYRYEQRVAGDADFRIWSLGPDGIDGTADDIEVREAGASR